MAEELIYLAPGEGLPGFPSGHGPGAYLVDYELRTIRPLPLVVNVQDYGASEDATDNTAAIQAAVNDANQGG